ncbi:MAG: alpha/beta hydrolase [Rikenellaceae bacterium]
MKKLLATLTLLIGVITTLTARDFGGDLQIKLWDNTTAPHSNGATGEEIEVKPFKMRNVSEARLYIFKAERSKSTGQAVVICPGGGYWMLSMDQEGVEMAQWLAQNGITAAVLKYRDALGVKEVPFEDAVEALRVMRKRAGELNIEANKVGIVGSSAGGHLAASVSTLAEDSQKPNFSVLLYPVITNEKGKGHQGSFNNLLGKDRTEEESAYFSLEKRVTATTPPAILFHSDDDKVVPSVSSTRYYTALKNFDIPASLHIYPKGGHGWGVSERFEYRVEWMESLLEWFKWLNKTEKNNKK